MGSNPTASSLGEMAEAGLKHWFAKSAGETLVGSNPALSAAYLPSAEKVLLSS